MPMRTRNAVPRPAFARNLHAGGAGVALALLLATAVAGCAGSTPLPQTRSLITMTGERVQADPEAMVEVDRWLRPQLEDMERNDSYTIRVLQEDRAAYPWDSLELMGDTAQITVQQGQADAETPYRIYAHFRLMAERNELERWLPEAADAQGFALERAILVRMADLWLLGRAVFDTTPYGPLDELLFAHEAGFLDEFIFATQGTRFEAERVAHYEDQPERATEFRGWFVRTFEVEGPRYLPDGDAVATEADDGGSDGR